MSKDAIKDQIDLASLIKNGYAVGSAELHSRLGEVGYTSAALEDLAELLARAQGARSTALSERGDRSGAPAAPEA